MLKTDKKRKRVEIIFSSDAVIVMLLRLYRDFSIALYIIEC